MALAQRFNEVTTYITHISELDVNMKYPIERAARITRFGDIVLLSIRDTAADRLHKVFLPQRYGAAFKGEEIQSIMKGLLICGWCQKESALRQTPTSWLLNRHCFHFRWTCLVCLL